MLQAGAWYLQDATFLIRFLSAPLSFACAVSSYGVCVKCNAASYSCSDPCLGVYAECYAFWWALYARLHRSPLPK